MKFCVACGLNYEDEFATCPQCAGAVKRDGKESIGETDFGQSGRPDGSLVIPSGVAFLAGGLLLALAAGIGSVWFVIGVASANLGMLMLLVGYVVKAISFLPGRTND